LRGQRRGRLPSASLLLTLLGLASLLICLIPVTTSEEVINATFTLSPSTRYAPPNAGTNYHTRIFGRSVLRGEGTVEGNGIYLTVYGYNTKNLEKSYLGGRYTFAIDPADDLYTFIFDNTEGRGESSVQFTLEETWTRPLAISSPHSLVASLIGLSLFLTGSMTLALTRIRRTRNLRVSRSL